MVGHSQSAVRPSKAGRLLLLMIAGLVLAPSATTAAERTKITDRELVLPSSVVVGRLWVGRTGILCYQAPCPWRGVTAAADGTLLWSGEALPALDAKPADAARLKESWAAFECLAVDGQFAAGQLTVKSILGGCFSEDSAGP